MKAIVANVLFGGIFGCLGWSTPTLANPKFVNQTSFGFQAPTISAKLLVSETWSVKPQVFNLVDRILTINQSNSFRNSINSNLTLDKQPYIQNLESVDLVLGFQNTFWPSANQDKYWGVTTVEHWGQGQPQLNLPQLNYTDTAPVLSSGSSALTFSGGGNRNLTGAASVDLDTSEPNYNEIRGGITYHHGVANQVTMGVGVIYENDLTGFTQLTYDSDIIPLKTTFSLLVEDSAVNLHSHLRLQPANNFVVNYYNNLEQEQHRFDLNWHVSSDLSLVAKGNTKNDSYSSGIKFAVHNDFLALSATATLDNDYNLQWKLDSQIGRFKLSYSSDQQKSSVELSSQLVNSKTLGMYCSGFVKYQTRLAQKNQSEFAVWGARFSSITKNSSDKHLWSWEVGYGSGNHGKGLVVNSSIALRSNLALKLEYQEISAISDNTTFKIQLSSN